MNDTMGPVCPACAGTGTGHIHRGTCAMGRRIGLPDTTNWCPECAARQTEIERLRAELERERAFKESYYGQLQEIFAKYKQWSDTPDGYVGDAPYWKGPSKND